VTAFDVDPRMIALARRTLARFSPGRVELGIGSAAAIPVADASFDAVFDFGILHHVSDWQKAVREVARVLRPGGRFYFEEVTKEALGRWVYRTLFDHPTENRFSVRDFATELDRNGLHIRGHIEPLFSSDFFIGVSERQAATLR
jgi:ubiquinone/menaquinone biosynthesis C-methylase UbiE